MGVDGGIARCLLDGDDAARTIEPSGGAAWTKATVFRRFVDRQRLGKPTCQINKLGRVGLVQQLDAGLTEGEPQLPWINLAQQLERSRSDSLHQLVPLVLAIGRLGAVIALLLVVFLVVLLALVDIRQALQQNHGLLLTETGEVERIAIPGLA